MILHFRIDCIRQLDLSLHSQCMLLLSFPQKCLLSCCCHWLFVFLWSFAKVQRCNSAAALAATWPLRNVRLSIYLNYFRTQAPNMPPFSLDTPTARVSKVGKTENAFSAQMPKCRSTEVPFSPARWRPVIILPRCHLCNSFCFMAHGSRLFGGLVTFAGRKTKI